MKEGFLETDLTNVIKIS